MPFDTGSSRGPGCNARIDYPGVGMIEPVGETPGLRAGLNAFSDAGIPGYYDNGLPGGGHGADAVGRLVGCDLKEAMSHVDRLMNIDVFTDDDVEMQNGMSLSTTFPPDEHGPVPRIEIRHRHRSARTVANREFLVGKAVELLRTLGATKVYRINKPPCFWCLALLLARPVLVVVADDAVPIDAQEDRAGQALPARVGGVAERWCQGDRLAQRNCRGHVHEGVVVDVLLALGYAVYSPDFEPALRLDASTRDPCGDVCQHIPRSPPSPLPVMRDMQELAESKGNVHAHVMLVRARGTFPGR